MNPAHAVVILFGLPMLIVIILYALEWAAELLSHIVD